MLYKHRIPHTPALTVTIHITINVYFLPFLCVSIIMIFITANSFEIEHISKLQKKYRNFKRYDRLTYKLIT